MKKSKLACLILSASMLFGGVITAVGTTYNAPSKQADATVVFSEEKDMSKAARGDKFNVWKADEGDFVKQENWFYSGKGFSFEFKIQEEGGFASGQGLLGVLLSGDEQITGDNKINNRCYMIRLVNNVPTMDKFSIGEVVDIGSGWYRYEVMFAEFGNLLTTPESAYKTVDALSFIWTAEGYWYDMTVRNMTLIEEAPERNTNFDPSGKYAYSFNRSLPTYRHFFTSTGKGVFINFHTTTNVRINFGNVNGVAMTEQFYARNAGDPANSKGKLFSLGNDWYRYEIMLADIAVTGTVDPSDENTDNLGIIFVPWGTAYSFDKTKGFGIIDGYSCMVTFVVGDTITTLAMSGKVTRPADPVMEGKHFGDWYTDDKFTTPYDFETPLTSDLTLYARMGEGEEHVFNKEVQAPQYFVSEPNCKHGTIYHKSCDCGKMGEDTFEVGSPDKSKHIAGDSHQENVVQPTCEGQGSYDEVVRCTVCDEILSSAHYTIDPIGHRYIEKEWTLADNKETATLTLVCEHDSTHTQTVNATVTKKVVKEATYDEEGVMEYTMTASYGGKSYKKTVSESIPKLVKKSGCGGEIISSSIILATLALAGVGIVLGKKKKED